MIERKGRLQRRCDATRDEALSREQTRQESSLQPLVLEPTPSNASVAPFVDFQRLSFAPSTPALLDNAGLGTNPGTEEQRPRGTPKAHRFSKGAAVLRSGQGRPAQHFCATSVRDTSGSLRKASTSRRGGHRVYTVLVRGGASVGAP